MCQKHQTTIGKTFGNVWATLTECLRVYNIESAVLFAIHSNNVFFSLSLFWQRLEYCVFGDKFYTRTFYFIYHTLKNTPKWKFQSSNTKVWKSLEQIIRLKTLTYAFWQFSQKLAVCVCEWFCMCFILYAGLFNKVLRSTSKNLKLV